MSLGSHAALERALRIIVAGSAADNTAEIIALLEMMTPEDLRTFEATAREMLSIIQQMNAKCPPSMLSLIDKRPADEEEPLLGNNTTSED